MLTIEETSAFVDELCKLENEDRTSDLDQQVYDIMRFLDHTNVGTWDEYTPEENQFEYMTALSMAMTHLFSKDPSQRFAMVRTILADVGLSGESAREDIVQPLNVEHLEEQPYDYDTVDDIYFDEPLTVCPDLLTLFESNESIKSPDLSDDYLDPSLDVINMEDEQLEYDRMNIEEDFWVSDLDDNDSKYHEIKVDDIISHPDDSTVIPCGLSVKYFDIPTTKVDLTKRLSTFTSINATIGGKAGYISAFVSKLALKEVKRFCGKVSPYMEAATAVLQSASICSY